MTKKQAGERKRTVTVVVGPMTVVLMERLNTFVNQNPGKECQGLTGLAGACLNYSLAVWAKEWLGEGDGRNWSHWE